jgi:hypothetical protein
MRSTNSVENTEPIASAIVKYNYQVSASLQFCNLSLHVLFTFLVLFVNLAILPGHSPLFKLFEHVTFYVRYRYLISRCSVLRSELLHSHR